MLVCINVYLGHTKLLDDSPTAAGKVATLSYDDLDRLTRAVVGSVSFGTSFTHTFAYDPIGNITSKSDQGLYSYATQSLGGSYANPDAVYNISHVASFSYDNDGNLTNIASSSSNIATISWDYKNELATYKSSAASVSYAYDSSGQRVKVKTGSATTYYPTKFYNTDGTHILKDIFTPDGLLVATVKGTGASISMHYVHPDHLGSTNVVSDESGAKESLNDYFEYGASRVSQGMPQSQRKFIGEQTDADTTLDYLNARYQNGRWGRFVSQDPSFLAMGDPTRLQQLTGQDQKTILSDPQSLNTYSYANGNPVTQKDPKGNFAEVLAIPAFALTGPEILAIGAAVAITTAAVYEARHIQWQPRQVPNIGLPSVPGGPEDMIPNLRPDLPSWAKWIIGGLVGTSIVNEINDKQQEVNNDIKNMTTNRVAPPNPSQGSVNIANPGSENIKSTLPTNNQSSNNFQPIVRRIDSWSNKKSTK